MFGCSLNSEGREKVYFLDRHIKTREWNIHIAAAQNVMELEEFPSRATPRTFKKWVFLGPGYSCIKNVIEFSGWANIFRILFSDCKKFSVVSLNQSTEWWHQFDVNSQFQFRSYHCSLIFRLKQFASQPNDVRESAEWFSYAFPFTLANEIVHFMRYASSYREFPIADTSR